MKSYASQHHLFHYVKELYLQKSCLIVFISVLHLLVNRHLLHVKISHQAWIVWDCREQYVII